LLPAKGPLSIILLVSIKREICTDQALFTAKISSEQNNNVKTTVDGHFHWRKYYYGLYFGQKRRFEVQNALIMDLFVTNAAHD